MIYLIRITSEYGPTWENNIKMNLKEIICEWVGWVRLTQDICVLTSGIPYDYADEAW